LHLRQQGDEPPGQKQAEMLPLRRARDGLQDRFSLLVLDAGAVKDHGQLRKGPVELMAKATTPAAAPVRHLTRKGGAAVRTQENRSCRTGGQGPWQRFCATLWQDRLYHQLRLLKTSAPAINAVIIAAVEEAKARLPFVLQIMLRVAYA
jgi:hypothetical protein